MRAASDANDGGTNWRALLVPLALVSLTLVAYSSAFDAGFIWDDEDYVTHNPVLRDVGGLRQIWFEPTSLPQWYPLVHTLFWFEYQAWGLEAAGYHVVNILLHSLAAILLWVLLRRLEIPGALLAAAVFAVHPVHVESVAWITERKNVLSGALYLAALLAWLRWQPLGGEARGSPRWWWASLLLFVGALLSKTVTCSLPAAILVLTWWRRGRLSWRGNVVPLIPFFAVGAVLAFVTASLEQTHVLAQGADWDLSFTERFLIAGRAVWFYLWKLLVPVGLAFNYPRWAIDAGDVAAFAFPVAAIALLVVAYLGRSRWGRGPFAALLLFGGTLLPALGFIDVYPMIYSFVADHFQYLASVAMIVLLASGATVLARSKLGPEHAGARVAGGALVGVLALLTWRQARIYESLEVLWRDTLSKNENSWLACNNLAVLLIDRGDFEGARGLLERSLAVKDRNAPAHANYGIIAHYDGDVAEAMRHFELAIEYKPNSIQAMRNLAALKTDQGRLDEAKSWLLRAVEFEPRYGDAHARLGSIFLRQGERESARRHFERALESGWDGEDVRLSLGDLLLADEEPEAAAQQFEIVVTRNRASLAARRGAARAVTMMGRPEDAVRVLGSAVALSPDDASLRAEFLAAVLAVPATAPASVAALVENGLSGKPAIVPSLLDQVAKRLLAAGRRDDAAACWNRATQLAQAAGNTGEAASYRSSAESARD